MIRMKRYKYVLTILKKYLTHRIEILCFWFDLVLSSHYNRWWTFLQDWNVIEVMVIFYYRPEIIFQFNVVVFVGHYSLKILEKVFRWKRYLIVCKRIFNLFNHSRSTIDIFKFRNRIHINSFDSLLLSFFPKLFLQRNILLFYSN